uniref:Serpentine Receptor, class T n=1 Tax=Caenorhabditis japonica TaxID=281687 RepID=A0A8R1DJI8_CAEJA
MEQRVSDNPRRVVAHTPEEWSARDGVRRPLYGLADMAYGVTFNILYIPILSVLIEKQNIKMSCFKIMTFLAIVDMLAIWVNSIITGFLAFQGAVFCTYPNLIYIAGMSGLGLWCCSCVIAMSLVMNRLFDLTKPEWGNVIFDGNRTYVMLAMSIIYGLYFVIFTTPVAFSSKYHTWFFDPLIFVNRTEEYANIPHGFNNFLVVTVTCFLYLSFCFVIGHKMKAAGAQCSSNTQKISTQIFLQSAMICAINQIASIIYVIMNFIDVPFWLIILGHSMWQFGHGAPALIYLFLNKTIRNGVLRKLGLKKKHNVVTSRDVPSTAFSKTN